MTVCVVGQKTTADLTAASLEDLMNIEITSVSKKEAKLFQSAAAVTVITREDIRRSGMTSIPDLLRMVPGLDVAQIDGSKWAVSARGFNGRFANKLLVLIDGRSIYSPQTSGVYWEAQDLLLEDIERIEIIRGPGGTMWGANAVNGVISIITKSAAETQGGLIVAGSGSQERDQTGIRYGGKIGDTAQYRISGKYFTRTGLSDAAGVDANEGHKAFRGGGRIDWQLNNRDSLTFSGDLFLSKIRETSLTISPATPFAPHTNTPGEFTGGHVLGRWARTFSPQSNLALKVYYDRFSRDVFDMSERINTFDVDFQHNVALSKKHDVVWGFGYRRVSDSTDSTNSTPMRYNPAKRTVQLFSAFAQDEVILVKDRLRLTLGAKLEHNDFSGFELQPNILLLWTPRNNQTVWGSVSRAVKAASRSDEDLRVNVAAFPGPRGMPVVLAIFGNPDLKSERVTAYELGYRAQAGKRFSLDVATFYNVYDRLTKTEAGAPFLETDPLPAHLVSPLIFKNLMRGETYGAETSLNVNVARQWRLAGSYSFIKINLHLDPLSRANGAEEIERSSPQHQFQLHSYVKLPRNLEFDVALYHVSRILQVPRYTRVDVRLGWRFSENVEFSFAGQNLLDARHAEYGGSDAVRRVVSRSASGKLTWRF
jgi:iron complex outermembrane receptor protein